MVRGRGWGGYKCVVPVSSRMMKVMYFSLLKSIISGWYGNCRQHGKYLGTCRCPDRDDMDPPFLSSLFS